jgi:pSer/pThr/pTyr-binding forkhead associated (FHA) protein
MDSTNGTYVAGQRVRGEAPLEPDSDVRFGGVKLAFRVLEPPKDEVGGTRVVVSYRPGTPVSPPAVTPTDASGVTPEEGGIPKLLLGGLLLLALVVVILVLRSF